MFDALFDGLAWLLAIYYTLGHNYGIAIILFTLTVMLILTPLTFYTTRSMLRMQSLQPEVKKIQAQYQGDRQRMNEEMMRLYQANNVNPLGSCLPILAQLPVFFVLFRLIQGLTRRVSDLGSTIGWRFKFGENDAVPSPSFDERTFNPEYLAADSELRKALENDTEMNFLGMDLSANLTDAFRDSFSTALPYLLLIVLIGVSSYVQQRQIAGRRDPDTPVNPQQQMIMKVMPWFLPIISVGFPAGLNLYFVSSNIVRVGQQAVITRRIYNPHRERQALIESTKEDEEEGEEEPPEPVRPAPRPRPAPARQWPTMAAGGRHQGLRQGDALTAAAQRPHRLVNGHRLEQPSQLKAKMPKRRALEPKTRRGRRQSQEARSRQTQSHSSATRAELPRRVNSRIPRIVGASARRGESSHGVARSHRQNHCPS